MATERLARILLFGLLAVVLVVSALALFPNVLGRLPGNDVQVIEIHARMPENGGWSLETIQARVGQPIKLRLTSDDVVHGLSIGQSDQAEVVIKPGEWSETTLVFDQPGRYIYYCTRWCGKNHWRMRGTIEVSGPGPTETQSAQPLYVQLGLDIDAPHHAQVVPAEPPSVENGAALASRLPEYALTQDTYQTHSPAQLYIRLRDEAALSDLNENALWDMVAFVWSRQATPERMAAAAQRFAKNCAACHGETGKGDGVIVVGLPAFDHTGGMHGVSRPPDFTDPHLLLGASPAILEGKLIRGGMGTGMPYWGPIFTEEQIDDLVAYVYTFAWQGVSTP